MRTCEQGTKNLNIQIDFSLWKQIQRASFDDCITLSNMVRQAIKDWLDKRNASLNVEQENANCPEESADREK